MATAIDFHEWEDAGLAFSAEEVEDYSVMIQAALRNAELLDLYLTIKAYEKLPYGLHAWAKDALYNTRNWITWTCARTMLEFPSELVWELPENHKSFTARAALLGPWDLTCEELVKAEACMTRSVTLGRRANTQQKWSKSQRSVSNKFCYTVLKQVRGMQHWQDVIKSFYPPSERGQFDS